MTLLPWRPNHISDDREKLYRGSPAPYGIFQQQPILWTKAGMEAPKLLIIDDKEVNRTTIGKILLAEGFQVLTASDAADGFRMGCTESPDMILLDVMMPGESGFDVCARLKSERATAEIPIIFLSALDD